MKHWFQRSPRGGASHRPPARRASAWAMLAAFALLAAAAPAQGPGLFVGPVESIDAMARSFRLGGGPEVLTSPATGFFDAATGMVASFDDLAVGGHVEVEGDFVPNGNGTASLAARFVTLLEGGNGGGGGGGGGDTFIVSGQLQAVDLEGGFVGVQGAGATLQFVVDENTQVFDPAGSEASLSFLSPGQNVDILAFRAGANMIPLALEIHVQGENPPPLPIVFTGTIEGLDAMTQSLFVAGHNVRTDEATTYANSNGEAIPFSALATGDFVRVTALHADPAGFPGGLLPELIALSIEQLDGAGPNRLNGVVTAVNLNAETGGDIAIDNRPVLVSANTQVRNQFGSPLSLDALEVGQLVEALLNPMTAGPIPFADVVTIFDEVPPPDFFFFGRIDAIDLPAGVFVLDNHLPIGTDASTTYSDENGEPLSFEDLLIGDFVEVTGQLEGVIVFGDGNTPPAGTGFLAKTVRRVPAPPPPTFFFSGELDAIDAEHGKLTIDQWIVSTTENTQYFGANGASIGFGDLALGQFLRVEATASNPAGGVAGGELVALTVSVVDSLGETFLAGQVTSLDLENSQFGVWMDLVNADENTEFVDVEGNELSLEELNLGDFVHVWASIQPNNVFLALHVEVLRNTNPPPGDIFIDGRIQTIDAENEVLFVAGHFVYTNEETEYIGLDGMAIGFGDLNEGDLVRVEGESIFFPTGTGGTPGFAPAILANQVTLLDEGGPTPIIVVGPIASIEGDAWTVQNATFAVDPMTTVLRNQEGFPLELGDFSVGDDVLAELSLANTGALPVALSVTLLNDHGGAGEFVHIVGAIQALPPTGDTLIVNGNTVTIDDDTLVLDRAFNLIELSDLHLGDVVRVLGFRQEDHSVLAEVVRLLPNAPPAPELGQLSGHIESIDPQGKSFAVGMTLVRTDEETTIVGRHGLPLAFDDLMEGQFVHVVGLLFTDGSMLARFVHAHQENQTGGGDASAFGHAATVSESAIVFDGGFTAIVNPDTTYANWNGEPATLADIHVGSNLHAVGEPAPGPENPSGATDALVAKRVQILPDVIMELTFDVFEGQAVIHSHGAAIIVANDATITDPNGEQIDAENLMLGDAFLMEASWDGAAFTASSIALIERPNLGGGAAEFVATVNTAVDGGLKLRSPENEATFGYVSLASRGFVGVENTLYDVRVRVATNVENPADMPTLRLRLNQSDWEKGTVLTVNPGNVASVVPTADGFEYRLLYAPTAEQRAVTGAEEPWFLSVDMASFNGQGPAGAEFTVRGIDARPVGLAQVAVERSLAHDRFLQGDDGWASGGAPGAYTVALAGAGGTGSLDLAATDHETFGFWTKEFPSIKLEAGKTYRARFLVRSSVSDPAATPQFRLRLNSNTYQLGSEVVINPTGDRLETAAGGRAETYDAYLSVPAQYEGGEWLVASFDLINLDEAQALNQSVSLTEFVVEEVRLP